MDDLMDKSKAILQRKSMTLQDEIEVENIEQDISAEIADK